MHEPHTQQLQRQTRSENTVSQSLFDAMARWYFGASVEKEPPLDRGVGQTVTISDSWLGILCLSYYGNGPRHPSVQVRQIGRAHV